MVVIEAGVPPRHEGRSVSVLAKNIGVLAGSQIITWCASLAWALFVPRALGPGETGVFTLSVAASGILTVLIGLGTRPLLVREISIDRNRASSLISTAIVLRAILAVPMLIVLGSFADLGKFTPEQIEALFLGWMVCVLYLLFEPIQAGLQALEKMQYLAYSAILTKTCVSLVSVALVFFGYRAVGLLTLTVIVLAMVLLLHIVWMRRNFSVDWTIRRDQLWSLATASIPYLGFALFFTFYLWIDSLMLSVMTPSDVLGWYGLPTKLFGTLMFVPVILSTAWLPRLAAAHAQGDDVLWQAARGPLQVVLALSLPVCLGVALVSNNLILFLYGNDFRQAIPVACVINPALNLILIPYFQSRAHNGAIGAAISLLVTELVLAAIGIAVIRNTFDSVFMKRISRAMVAAAGMGLAVLAARELGLAPAILVGLAVYPILAVLLRVMTRQELTQLLEVVRTRRTRLSAEPAMID